MSVTEAKRKKGLDEVDIRLSDIVYFLTSNRRRILLGIIIGLIIGALYAFSKPNVYTTQVSVLPEAQATGASGLGSLGSLAGLAGINLNNIAGQDAIRPDLYPNVLQSVPFALDLLKQPVYLQGSLVKISLQEFMNRQASGFLGGLFKRSSNTDDSKKTSNLKNFSQAIQVTKEQEDLIKAVQESVSAIYDKKTGIITITVVETDPMVSAIVARLSLEYLTKYITTYRTEKARQQVTFLKAQVRDSEIKYQASEYALSDYRDRNRNLFLQTAKINEQRLQADYLLAQSVYGELSKQLEQAKIKVQQETPIFKTLEPPTVPLRKSGPKRTFIMVGFAAVGAFLMTTLALIRQISRRHLNPIV